MAMNCIEVYVHTTPCINNQQRLQISLRPYIPLVFCFPVFSCYIIRLFNQLHKLYNDIKTAIFWDVVSRLSNKRLPAFQRCDTTRRNNLEDNHFITRRRENLKCHLIAQMLQRINVI